MWGKAKPVPDGFHTITPSLVVRDAIKAIDFYKRAFGAESKNVHQSPEGKVIHAEVRVGDSILMLTDEFAGSGCNAPPPGSSTSVTLHVYTENADEMFNRAVSAGAAPVMPMTDAFWGDRYGQVRDPFGHLWAIAVHQEDLSAKDIEKRSKEFFAKAAKPSA